MRPTQKYPTSARVAHVRTAPVLTTFVLYLACVTRQFVTCPPAPHPQLDRPHAPQVRVRRFCVHHVRMCDACLSSIGMCRIRMRCMDARRIREYRVRDHAQEDITPGSTSTAFL